MHVWFSAVSRCGLYSKVAAGRGGVGKAKARASPQKKHVMNSAMHASVSTKSRCSL